MRVLYLLKNDDGNANYVGADMNGVINNGESKSNSQTESSETAQTEITDNGE